MIFRILSPIMLLMASAQFLGAAEGGEHHELTAYPLEVFRLGPLVVTNSMIITITVAALLILFAQMATKKMALVPSGLQNFAEWLVEALYDFLEGLMGAELTKKTFWFFASIFIFILATNWFGLIPGVGTIGKIDDHGHYIPFLRGGNADLNMTFAISLCFFVLWFVWAIQANGVGGFLKHIFMPTKAHWAIMIIFLAVGVIEVVSIIFRPVALTFRLYGNVFAGENLLETMLAIHPVFSFAIPIPFYFLELLVGVIQASVFMLLTALFTGIMCTHHDDHGDHDEDHHGESAAHQESH